jgi:Flp pilus assembly protein TadG
MTVVEGSTRRPDRRHRRRRRGQHGQATVETALVLPVVALLLLAMVQAGLLVRDRVLVVHAARSAARAVAVQPDLAAARDALGDVDRDRFSVSLGGDLGPGGLATVTVRARPTPVPLLGRLVSGVRLEQRLVVRVEEP